LKASPDALNDVDPQAWLADVLARLPDHRKHAVNNSPAFTGCVRRDFAIEFIGILLQRPRMTLADGALTC
jgi:hypothetical protein